MRGIANNLIGRTFGYWEVENFSYRDKRHNWKFVCRCSLCDRRYDVYGLSLLSGTSTKCRKCSNEMRQNHYARVI